MPAACAAGRTRIMLPMRKPAALLAVLLALAPHCACGLALY
jgi:hypothetical protein